MNGLQLQLVVRVMGALWFAMNECAELFVAASGPVDTNPRLAHAAGRLSAMLSRAWSFFDTNFVSEGGAK